MGLDMYTDNYNGLGLSFDTLKPSYFSTKEAYDLSQKFIKFLHGLSDDDMLCDAFNFIESDVNECIKKAQGVEYYGPGDGYDSFDDLLIVKYSTLHKLNKHLTDKQVADLISNVFAKWFKLFANGKKVKATDWPVQNKDYQVQADSINDYKLKSPANKDLVDEVCKGWSKFIHDNLQELDFTVMEY